MHLTRTRLAASAMAIASTTALLFGTSAPAGAVTDPDRGICQDGTNANPPGAWLRDANNVAVSLLYLTKTGYAGSQDHFYIEGQFTRADGAHWWTGFGYDVDNGIKTYGAVYDQWVARSGGGCP